MAGISKTCESCGAERMLYNPCPECGLPTFKDRVKPT